VNSSSFFTAGLSAIILLTPFCSLPAAEPSAVSTDVPLNANDLTLLARQAESKHDHVSAFRLYCAALAQDPKNQKLQKAVESSSKRAQKSLQKSRERQMKAYVRDAEKRLALTAAQETELRRRLAEGRKLMDGGNSFQAAVIFRQIQVDAPGFRNTQEEVTRLDRQLTRQIRRDRFPTSLHRQATQGIRSFFRGDWQDAVTTLGQTLDADTLPPDLALARLGDFRTTAQTHLNRIARDKRRADLWAKAQRAQESGRFKEAQTTLMLLLQEWPGDTEARARLAAVDKMVVGVKHTEIENKKLDQIPDLLTKGSLLSVQGHHTEALIVFQQVLDLDPKNVEARDQISEVEQAMKHDGHIIDAPVVFDDAESAYREGLRYYGNEEYDKAKQAFQQALKLNPTHRDAKEALARLNEERKSK
jgi:tetratricopeptide (TPR) repeat protein